MPSIMPPTENPALQLLRASPELLAQTQQEEIAPAPAIEYPEGFSFQDLKEKVKNLQDQWKGYIEKAEKNRLLRKMEVDSEAERRRGRFKPDEIYIPYHVINDNIGKEATSYISFIASARNAGIFKKRGQAAVQNFGELERFFTSCVRYDGYEQQIFPLIDGHQLHGVDYLEVKYDESKPGYFSFEHLGYNSVWYPEVVERDKFQLSPIIVTSHSVTKDELKQFPDVNMEQVELLFKDVVKNDPRRDYVKIQRVLYRMEGTVNVCWMNHEKNTDFVRAPKPLFLGRYSPPQIDPMTGMQGQPTKMYEAFYPIIPFPYSMTENKTLCMTMGRAALDENIQEAVSSIVSSIINGYNKASQVMWSPRNPTSTGEIEQLDIILEGGRGINQPVDFFSHPYPDESGMTLVNALLTQSKAETAQLNLAVGNRQDYASRKTAKEISTAEKKETELTSTQVVLFSTSWRQVLNIAYLITKSAVEMGLIIVDQGIAALMQAEDLDVLSAGDVEVVQRQETLQNLQGLWPIISQTPAAMPVLEDILRLMVPTFADKYIAAIQATDPAMLSEALANIIQAIAQQHPEVIPPENMQKLQMLIQEAHTNANTRTAATGQQSTQQPGNNTQSVSGNAGNEGGNIQPQEPIGNNSQ